MNTYGSISQRTAVYAAMEMLEHARPQLCLTKFGLSKPLPRNKSRTVKFRRPVPFTVEETPTPLTEGVTPQSEDMRYEDVEVTLQQYGGVTKLTDVIADLCEDSVLNDATELHGEKAARTMEKIAWGAVKGGTNVIYSNGSARTDVNTPISRSDVRNATRTLRANYGLMVNKMLKGGPNFGTTPIQAGYIGFSSSDMDSDIRDIPGFVPVSEYGSMKQISEYEIGAVETVRFITTPELTPFTGAGSTTLNDMVSVGGVRVDVYPVIVIAREAFGIVPLSGKGAITPIVLNPNNPNGADPLGQRGWTGWKAYNACTILNQAWIVRIESAASTLD